MNKTQPLNQRKVAPANAKFVVQKGGRIVETFETKKGAEKYAKIKGGTVLPR